MSDETNAGGIGEILGLRELWAETLGDPRISVAILDGRADMSHPSLAGANLAEIKTLASDAAIRGGHSLRHGTHVASLIFGNHTGGIWGIAPLCRGIIAPVFQDSARGGISVASELDLARAITQALEAGASVINISGGELSDASVTSPILASVIGRCQKRGALVIAAAGNDGGAYHHIPAAMPETLVVGAMDWQGEPAKFSNWGAKYRLRGVLAPGVDIPGATAGGGSATQSGTSYAAPVVSGVAALLLSLQIKYGMKPNPEAVKKAILESAIGCAEMKTRDCSRLLAGRLNILGAMNTIIEGGKINMKTIKSHHSGTAPLDKIASHGRAIAPSGIEPSSGCGCGESGGECHCHDKHSHTRQLVFALGAIGYDFGTEARADSITQNMNPEANDPYDPEDLIRYLDENPHEAASVTWTLELDDTTIYAIEGRGVFGSVVYERLREFLGDQYGICDNPEPHEHEEIDRVAIAGYIVGQTSLSTGQTVPVIAAEPRGMSSWSVEHLVKLVMGEISPEDSPEDEKESYLERERSFVECLDRVYYEYRNLGISAEDRAINYTLTNILPTSEIIQDAINNELALDAIEVAPSPVCRVDSVCMDVKFYFFDAQNTQKARKVYIYTVDVSDVVPVNLGDQRSFRVR
ncbi:MAG: S8 family serine peptidase [Deltaproteobacteria bacterium]